MGVAASGATLEIQLVSDVARLKRDMADMRSAIEQATGGATASFSALGKGSAAAATQMAASAQLAARAAMSGAVGVKAMGTASNLSRIQMLELGHVATSLTDSIAAGINPARALFMEMGRLGQVASYSQGGMKGLLTTMLQMTGVIKVTRDAELEASAATAAAQAAALKSVAERAASTVAARQTQVALIQAEIAGATSAEAQAVAEARLVKALRDVEGAAAKAAIANSAFAKAQAEAAASAEAAGAAATRSITPLAPLLAVVAVGAGVAFGAMKQFQAQVKDSGELTRYRDSLGLTHKEMLQLSDGVEKVGGKIKGLTDVSVTVGDVMSGLWKTIEDQVAKGPGAKAWDFMRSAAVKAFNGILDAWSVVSAGITAGIYGTFNAAKQIWDNFPAVMGDLFIQAANLAIGGINKLLQASVSGLNWFIDKVNGVAGKTLIDSIAAPQGLAQIANQWQGAAAKTANSIADGYSKAYAQARKDDQAFWSQVKNNALQSAKDRMKAEADALIANRTPKKAHKESDHGLAQALAELDAQIKGQQKLADAYLVSDSEAMKATAMQKAEEQAIRHKGDIGLFYEKELALAVATRTAEGAKVARDLTSEAAARQRINDQVEAGLIPASQAGKALELEQKLRPLVAAAAVAEGDAKQRILNVIAALTGAQADLNAELAREAALRQEATNSDQLDQLQKEAELIGASNRARAVALAQLQAEQFAKNNNITDPAQIRALVKSYSDIANAQVDLAEKQNNYNASLTATVDLLKLMEQQAQSVAQLLSDAFGNVGDSVGKALTALVSYQSTQAQIQHDAEEARKAAGDDAEALARIQTEAATKSANAQIEATGEVIAAAKGLFKEHSAGYKAMDAIEKAYSIAQLARTIASIAPNIAAGAAKMFAELGPFAFPAIAAMIAVMAALGFSGGTSSATPPPTPEDQQAAAGTGTILGDPTGKSQSIANALDLMAKNSTRGLDYSAEMVRSLRGIEGSIGNLAAAIARSLDLSGGFFDTTGKTGTNTSGGFLGLFSSTSTKSLYDQGFSFDPATIEQIIEQGITGATYQVIETVKHNSGFLGLGSSTKTSYKTTTGPLDDDISNQIQLVVSQLYNSVVAAAKVLGLDVAAALQQFQVEIGKISFKDLTGDEIEQQLDAVFSKIGDQMAGFAVAGLEQFQKAGEGLFETLMRLAKDYLTIDAALKSIGMTFGAVGASSVAAREKLIDLAGGLDAFVSQVDFFYDHFLTDAQKVAFEQEQVTAAFQQMGVAMPTSIAGFTALVQSLDLSTDAGQALFEQLMQIAPAFYDVATAAEQLAQKQGDLQVQLLQAEGKTEEATELQRQLQLATMDPSLRDLQQQVWAAQDAAAAAAKAEADAAAAQDLANKKTQMQVQLLEAQGKAEEALALQRKLELSQLDPSLQSLQKQIYKAEDLATAKQNLVDAYDRESDALQQTADKFRKFATDLKAFRDSLFTGTDGALGYNQLLVRLINQAGLAAGGNEDALGGGLQDAAQKFLDVATQNAGSLQDVERARALVARYLDEAIGGANGQADIATQQLDVMKDQVSKLVDLDDHVLSVTDAIAKLTALMFPSATPPPPPTTGPRPNDPALLEKIQDHLLEIKVNTAAAAVAQNKTHRILDRADRGGALALVTDDDSPIKVTS